MKHIIKRGSCKLGGLIFTDLKDSYEFTDWVDRGCPSGYVKITPDISCLCNIPIVYAVLVNGIYIKHDVMPLVKTDYKIFSYMRPKKEKKHEFVPHTYNFVTCADPRQLDRDLRIRRK